MAWFGFGCEVLGGGVLVGGGAIVWAVQQDNKLLKKIQTNIQNGSRVR